MLNKKVNSKNTGIKLQRIKFVQSLQYIIDDQWRFCGLSL